MQTSAVKLHAKSDMHLAAWRLFQMPAGVSVIPSQCSRSDTELLRGHVPQSSDWLRCWKTNELALSSRAGSSLSLTEEFIQSDRIAIKEIERRAVSAMREVMQETVRARKRSLVALINSGTFQSWVSLNRVQCVSSKI